MARDVSAGWCLAGCTPVLPSLQQSFCLAGQSQPVLVEAVGVSWVQDLVPAFAGFCQGPAWPLSPRVLAELHLLPLSTCAQATWFGVTHKIAEGALSLLPGLFTDSKHSKAPGRTLEKHTLKKQLLVGYRTLRATLTPARFSSI